MTNIFVFEYAIKSINRRKRKQLAVAFVIALGVTLLVGVQIGSTGLENAFGSYYWSAAGDVDAQIWNPENIYMAGNFSDTLHSLSVSGLEVIESRIEYTLPIYSNNDGQFDPKIEFIGLNTTTSSHFEEFYDIEGNPINIDLLSTDNTVLISDTVAETMTLKQGDVIMTSIPDGLGGSVSTNFTVARIFDSHKGRGLEGNFDRHNIVYVNIRALQQPLLLNLSNPVTKFSIKFHGVTRNLKDVDVKDQTFPGMNTIIQGTQEIKSYLESENLPYLVNSFRIEAISSIDISLKEISAILNLLVVVLNATSLLLIVNVQSINFEDRKYQTAVLRAMGCSKSQIFEIFIIESGIVGIIGAIIGLIGGLFYGQWIQQYISYIYGINAASYTNISSGMISIALLAGIMLSIITSILPAWLTASRSITNELRGIHKMKEHKKSNLTLIIGVILTLIGLISAKNVSKFWTKAGWKYYQDQTSIMLALGLTLAGIGLLLSYIIPQKIALNISGFSFYGLALFSMTIAINWAEPGNSSSWFTVNLLFIVIGLLMLVTVNFEFLMYGTNKFLSRIPSFRAISLVSTRGMIGKKNRLSLVYAIFVIILILNVFLMSAAETVRVGNVESYQSKSHGIDLVVNTNIPNNQIKAAIESFENIEQVYAFRSYTGSVFRQNPLSPNFQLKNDLLVGRIVEVPEQVINPDSNFRSTKALPFSFFNGNSQFGYDSPIKMTNDEKVGLTEKVFTDFYNDKTKEYNDTTVLNGNITEIVETQHMVIGDYFTSRSQNGELGMQNLYFQTNDSHIPFLSTYSPISAFTMMGDWDFLAGSIMVSPQIANLLPEFGKIDAPNLFLIKTSFNYKDSKNLTELGIKIESKINDLNNPDSLSSQAGVLIGASSRVVFTEVRNFFKFRAQFWDFLGSFTLLGLIIGAIGMVIIAIRSVSERIREIGMMRAIGFKKSTVVFTIGLELLFITLLSLVTGIANGILFNETFAKFNLNTRTSYPIHKIVLYSGIIFLITVGAGIVPGIRAAKIPPSQSLRYSG